MALLFAPNMKLGSLVGSLCPTGWNQTEWLRQNDMSSIESPR